MSDDKRPAGFQRVCIFGAGAIGGWMGVHLARAGCDVSVVARGQTLASIEQHGLRLNEGGESIAVPVRASADPSTLGPQDLLVIAVKAPVLPNIMRSVAPLLGSDTTVLIAMNGVPWWFLHGLEGPLNGQPLRTVDPDGELAKCMPIERVIGCVVHASCSIQEPGLLRHHFGRQLIIGEPAGGASTRVRKLADLLNRASFETVVSERIQKDIWYKLWGNMTMNPVSALTGATADLILDDELVRGFMSQVMLEARDIGARIGIPIAQEPEDRHQMTRKLGAIKTSMLQDAESGKRVELDALVSAVRELGGLVGVRTPFTDALLGLARLHSRVRGLY